MSVKNEIKISFDARAFEATEHEHVKEIMDNLESKKSENEWVMPKYKITKKLQFSFIGIIVTK